MDVDVGGTSVASAEAMALQFDGLKASQKDNPYDADARALHKIKDETDFMLMQDSHLINLRLVNTMYSLHGVSAYATCQEVCTPTREKRMHYNPFHAISANVSFQVLKLHFVNES